MVLTSDVTASASGVFSLMAQEIDCVTSVGTTTRGIFSDVTIRILPNRWTFGFSSERYLNIHRVNYEQVGMKPDIFVDENLDALLKEDTDNVLEYAIENISSSCMTSSIKEDNQLSKINIYPNPFSNYVNIDLPNEDIAGVMISLIDISGKKVLQESLNNGTLNLSMLPEGFYTLFIQTGNQIINSKIIKSK